MVRRHSLCLSDIPSFAESLSIDTYHENEGQDDSIAIYTLRRASSSALAVMPVEATASVATDMDAGAEVNGSVGETGVSGEHSKAAKRKNKKKKNKSRPKKDKENDSSTADGGPLVVNGARWKHEVTGDDDGLQEFINVHKHPHYMTPRPSTQSSAVAFTPSTAPTENTIRPPSVSAHSQATVLNGHGQGPALNDQAQAQLPFSCPEHGRTVCQFLPGCCVHRFKECHFCPSSRSCCCMHHAGDCCHCVLMGVRVGEYPELHDQSPPTAESSNQIETASDTSQKRHASTNGTINTDTALNDYTLHLLETESFTDTRIILKSPKDTFYPITFRAHKALLARSPHLKSILFSSSSNRKDVTSAEIRIEAIAGEAFCMVKAFETALQNLYGRPVLDLGGLRDVTVQALGYDTIPSTRGHEGVSGNAGMMDPCALNAALADFAMCYAVSGAFLGSKDIVEAGIKLVEDVRCWDNVEMVLYFSLCMEKFLIQHPAQDNAKDTTNKDLTTHHAPNLTTSTLTFLTTPFTSPSSSTSSQTQASPPIQFSLYISAQPTQTPDRIPSHLRKVPGSILSNPKLAEVKFGEFASLEEQKPAREVIILSAVLIALPFEQARELFAIMQGRGIFGVYGMSGGDGDDAALAQAVIVEREARRLYALRVLEKQRQVAQMGGCRDDLDSLESEGDVQELGYREFCTVEVVESVVNGDGKQGRVKRVSLEREWVGLGLGGELDRVKHR